MVTARFGAAPHTLHLSHVQQKVISGIDTRGGSWECVGIWQVFCAVRMGLQDCRSKTPAGIQV